MKSFIDATASDSPVPGGGSVSALCASLGAALSTMVCRLTLGRKKYADSQQQVEAVIAITEPAIANFHDAIAADSDAYAAVMQAFKLPKDTDEEKAARRQAIQRASKLAAEVPFTVAVNALGVMRTAAVLVDCGNPNAITDVGVAMMCLRTAVLGAALNVRINLGGIDDQDFVAAHDCGAIEAEAIALCDAAYNSIITKL